MTEPNLLLMSKTWINGINAKRMNLLMMIPMFLFDILWIRGVKIKGKREFLLFALFLLPKLGSNQRPSD